MWIWQLGREVLRSTWTLPLERKKVSRGALFYNTDLYHFSLCPVSFQEGRLRRGNACLVFMLGSLLLWSHLLEMEPPPGHWSREDGEILRVLIWG